MLNLLLASTSTIFEKPYLVYLKDEIIDFFKSKENILFIPYARPSGISHDEYTAIATNFFKTINKNIRSIHEWNNVQDAMAWSDGIFTGGGNTFVLIDQLYKNNAIQHIRNEVAKGKPYMGTSAGSNIAGQTICTTNDMPIVYPPSFDALQLVPFNLNPHYIEPPPNNKHMGETRATRIKEFHAYNSQIVVGLREGSAIRVHNNMIKITGELPVKIFKQGQNPFELQAYENFNFLLTNN